MVRDIVFWSINGISPHTKITFWQLSKYFDPSHNRKEYVDLSEVERTPLAFIYIDFFEDNGTYNTTSNCSAQFSYYDESQIYYPWVYYDEWTGYGDAADWTIKDAFDYVDNDNGCVSTYIRSLSSSISFFLLLNVLIFLFYRGL